MPDGQCSRGLGVQYLWEAVAIMLLLSSVVRQERGGVELDLPLCSVMPGRSIPWQIKRLLFVFHD